MTDSVLLESTREGVRTLTLNRPTQFNAMTGELLDELLAAFDRVAADDSVRVVILAGTGKAFCAGHDLKQARAHEDLDYQRRLFGRSSEIMQRIVALPQPVIARVHGMTTAAGCQLVAGCDLAVAAAGDVRRLRCPAWPFLFHARRGPHAQRSAETVDGDASDRGIHRRENSPGVRGGEPGLQIR